MSKEQKKEKAIPKLKKVIYTVLSNLKRDGKLYTPGNKIEKFKGIENLIKDGVIAISD